MIVSTNLLLDPHQNGEQLMIKEKPLISAQQAKNLIYTMVQYGDHRHQELRKLDKFKIQEVFKFSGYPWKQLVENVRSPKNPIPGVENLAGYEWSLNASKNTTLTVYHNNHPVKTLTESG